MLPRLMGLGRVHAPHRKLDTKRSTETDPVPTHLAGDAKRLSSSEPSLTRVSINPVAHVFRAGSRIRLTLQAPGGDRPLWTWKTIDTGTTKVTATGSKSFARPIWKWVNKCASRAVHLQDYGAF